MCSWLEDLCKSKLVLVITEIQPVHPKGNHSWIFIGRTDVEAETPILWPLDATNWLIWKYADDWKDPARLKAREERDDGGWDGWMASPTQWTWVWVNSRSWWWTGRPGMLQSRGSQRVGHDWATELNWVITDPNVLGLLGAHSHSSGQR